MRDYLRWLLALVTVAAGLSAGGWFMQSSRQEPPCAIIVMDPLAKPLACACVGNYAQRDYGPLAAFLSSRLHRRFQVVYAESLDRALQGMESMSVAVVIGKASIVDHDSRRANLTLKPVACLADAAGSTTLTGMFIVRTNDTARSLGDLTNRTILFGPVEAQEKHGAAIAALKAAGVSAERDLQTRNGCSEAALEIVESKADPLPVAVISSYALPLLEGCGSIPPGMIRVIGRTAPVPFIRIFQNPSVLGGAEPDFRRVLKLAGEDPGVMGALEPKGNLQDVTLEGAWPDWRGPGRDGQVAWLPESLPRKPRMIWSTILKDHAMGGIALAEGKVLVVDRDPETARDLFHCLNASDGHVLWQFSYEAVGELDYGAAPRATPVIAEGLVYTLGAFGALHCLELETGRVRWRKDLASSFGAARPRWGYSASPLLVDNLVIVNPGGKRASVAALDRLSGRLIWQAPGAPAAYGSFICGTFGGKRQVVGYDSESLGGWEVDTGRRIWRLEPKVPGDFNVPTPIAWKGQLILSTENNGTRIYAFRTTGEILPQPLAANSDLSPDSATGVVAGSWLVGCGPGLRGLELPALRTAWREDSEAFSGHASLVTAGERALALTFGGELCLFRPGANPSTFIRRRLLPAGSETYAHPALGDDRIYVRAGQAVSCYSLTEEDP